MWTIDLGLPGEKAYCLDYIEKRLADSEAGAHVTLAKISAGGRETLSVACMCDFCDKVSRALREIITDVVVSDFKYDYLLRNARVKLSDGLYQSALMTALVAFDREFDREYCRSNLELDGVLMIDGFYSFRLKELRERWKEICDLAGANVFYLSFNETYTELMRFLCSAITPVTDSLHIKKNGAGCVRLLSEDNSDIYLKAPDYGGITGDADLITSVISLSPNKIVIYGDPISIRAKEFIDAVYGGRVFYN
ncbi:MAG: putative sporulation protein YtxC [Firmicutes bacterium]|nr:putative sporulation protein YtxC [Bacillota bacterium]